MQLRRITSPSILPYLAPFIMTSPDDDKDRFIVGLDQLLRTKPESVFLLVAVEGEEFIAFIIAFKPEGYDYTILQQAWANPQKSPDNLTEIMFLKLISWAQNNECSQIRIETTRETEAITRKWGFKVYSQLMSLDIGLEFEEALLETIRKRRSSNERRTENNVVTDEKSESNIESTSGDPGEVSGTERGELPRADRAGIDAGVREDELVD